MLRMDTSSDAKATTVTQVPGSPDRVRGIMNLRGRVIPVVDLGECFGMGLNTSPDPRILVVDLGQLTVGVVVDSVSEVFTLSDDQVQSPPAEVSREDQAISGVIQSDERLIAVVDLPAVLGTATRDLPAEPTTAA